MLFLGFLKKEDCYLVKEALSMLLITEKRRADAFDNDSKKKKSVRKLERIEYVLNYFEKRLVSRA